MAKLSKAEQACRDYYRQILRGVMVSCDPSSGGGKGVQHSDPAFTLWDAGDWVETFSIKLKGTDSIADRLAGIMDAIHSPRVASILAIEDVGVIRGKFASVNKPLIWSAGVIIGAVRPTKATIEIMPSTWQKYINKATYNKSDIHDSYAIGWAAIQMAKGDKEKLDQQLMEDRLCQKSQ